MSTQLEARRMLEKLHITPTCRFGPNEYEDLELFLSALLEDAWLSVDEFMPEAYTQVLTCNAKSGAQSTGIWCPESDAWWWRSSWCNEPPLTVTHWQLLPDLPEEEK